MDEKTNDYENLIKYASATIFMAKLKANSRGDDVANWIDHMPKMVGDAYKSLSNEIRKNIENHVDTNW